MNKLYIIALILIAGLVPAAADESFRPTQYALSLSWSGCYEGQPDIFTRTSMLGFGFLVYSKDSLNIQNHITYSTGVMNREDTGIKLYQHLLTEKVSVGTWSGNGLFRPYGFVEGRVGRCGTEKYNMLDNPWISKFGIGTGVDIFALQNWSFMLELGFLGNLYEDEFFMQQRFELGVKVHFFPRAG